jgi:hypothetical protein
LSRSGRGSRRRGPRLGRFPPRRAEASGKARGRPPRRRRGTRRSRRSRRRAPSWSCRDPCPRDRRRSRRRHPGRRPLGGRRTRQCCAARTLLPSRACQGSEVGRAGPRSRGGWRRRGGRSRRSGRHPRGCGGGPVPARPCRAASRIGRAYLPKAARVSASGPSFPAPSVPGAARSARTTGRSPDDGRPARETTVPLPSEWRSPPRGCLLRQPAGPARLPSHAKTREEEPRGERGARPFA